KQALLQAVNGVTAAIFASTPPQRLLNILWWGAAPEWVETPEKAARYGTLMAILADTILASLPKGRSALDASLRSKLCDVAQTFSGVAGLEDRAAQLIATAQPSRAA
ncbi:hypothetical protein ACFOD4_19460, partial [Pseudoroseomonas globiformis]